PKPEQLAHLARVDGAVRDHLPHARALSVHEALQWCRGAPEAQPEHAVLEAAELCVERLAVARAREGERLAAVLAERVAHLRALNEAAAYAIRIDVAEELARLRSHLDEITRLLDKGGEIGKRLEFIIQELLREANTLGSKSPSIEMTAISVDMKVAIEQLREQ